MKKYKIAAPLAEKRSCQAAVIRPTNHNIKKPVHHFLNFLNIPDYDLVTMFGGPANLLEDGFDKKEAIFAVKNVAKDLHSTKQIILFSHLGKEGTNFKNFYSERYSQKEELVADLKEAAKIAREETNLEVKAYILELSDNNKDIIFSEVEGEETREVFIWPYKEKAKEALVLRCMDFRFREPTKIFLENILDLQSYDLVSIPGAVKGINKNKEDSQSYRAIEASVKNRDLKRVLLINHTDCGAYGGCKNFPDKETERSFMIEELKKAQSFLEEKFPVVEFQMYLEFFKDGNLHFEDLN